MAEDIVRLDITAMVEGWLQAEQQGEKFPVDFDLAWPIAGYSTKGNARRKLTAEGSGLVEGEDFAFIISDKWSQGGRSSDLIVMTCDAFKQFCLMAKTEQGKATRLYFIDAEKKWKLVQQTRPEVVEEIEMMHLQIELAKIEAQKEQSITQGKQADLQLIQFRHIVTTTMPEPIQKKILGYTEIPTIEYRDRVIAADRMVNDGSTITKTELCQRYGIKTRNGKPDYKALKKVLDDLPPDAFALMVRPQDNMELRRDWLPHLDRLFRDGTRTLYFGE